jgi:hypothetical protein
LADPGGQGSSAALGPTARRPARSLTLITAHALNLSHCEPRMTFTRYEQLRAMRRAARRLGMTRQQNEALFHDTAVRLIESVRRQPVAASPSSARVSG